MAEASLKPSWRMRPTAPQRLPLVVAASRPIGHRSITAIRALTLATAQRQVSGEFPTVPPMGRRSLLSRLMNRRPRPIPDILHLRPRTFATCRHRATSCAFAAASYTLRPSLLRPTTRRRLRSSSSSVMTFPFSSTWERRLSCHSPTLKGMVY